MSMYDNTDAFGSYLNAHPGQTNAWETTTALLSKYGLGTLSEFAKNAIVQGYGASEIIQRVRETPEYKQRFSALIERQQKGLSPISEGDYVNIERGYQQAAASVGISPDYFSQEKMAQLIAHDKSPSEVQSQLVATYQKVSSDPSLAPQLNRLYGMGVSPGEAAAFFLDPDHTEAYLTKQVTAAEMAARSQATGFGQLDKTSAEHLAGIGVSASQAQQGFGQLAQQSALFQQNASEGNSIDQSVGISAVFDNNAADQATLTRRRAERQGAFSGGGNFTDPNKQGITGAGTANS